MEEAEALLDKAISKLDCIQTLGEDNEADNIAYILSASVTKDKNTLHRARIEAEELWWKLVKNTVQIAVLKQTGQKNFLIFVIVVVILR